MTKKKSATPSQEWLGFIYDSDLPGHQKAIAAFLAFKMWGNANSCWPSASTISKNTGFSERKVRDCVNALIEQKWLKVNGLNKSGTRILSTSTPAHGAPPAHHAPAQPAPLHTVLPPPAHGAPESVSESVKNIHRGKRFVPPTVEQVAEYVAERGSTVDPETFVDWNSSKGWMIGKNKMKDWKAAVRTWEKRDNQNGQNRQSGRSNSRGVKVTKLGDSAFNSGYVIDG